MLTTKPLPPHWWNAARNGDWHRRGQRNKHSSLRTQQQEMRHEPQKNKFASHSDSSFFLLFRQNYSSLILRKKKKKGQGDYVYDFMKSRDKKQNENKLHVWKSLFFVFFLDKTKQKEFPWLLTLAREEVCFRQVSEVKPKSVTSVTRSCGCVSLSRPPLRLSHRVSLDNLCVSSATPERISGDTDDGKNGCSSKLKHPHIC